MVILSRCATTFHFATFLVQVLFRLGNKVKGNGQTDALTVIEGGKKVDAFDTAPLCRVVVPANDVVLVGVRLSSILSSKIKTPSSEIPLSEDLDFMSYNCDLSE
jgi:hypothetical protein